MTQQVSDDLFVLMSRHKLRAVHCEITNTKCLASSAKSNHPTPSTFERVCKEHCPWSMKYQSCAKDVSVKQLDEEYYD